jgi:hypothetical protein
MFHSRQAMLRIGVSVFVLSAALIGSAHGQGDKKTPEQAPQKDLKLNYEQTFELEDGTREITVDPVDREQTIKIDVKANGGPMNFYVYLARDANTARKDNPLPKDADRILRKVEKTESTTIDVPIPANSTATVFFKLASAKTANVTVKITN